EVPPQKILCLTYTKAAASHMQTQLFDRLGGWAMLDDDELKHRLDELGENAEKLSPTDLRHARTLFARALETPGGLKIQTIHSFCAALLRRFPLEAGVSPRFQEIDERNGKKLRAEILEDMAESPDQPAFDGMAKYLSGDDPDSFIQEIAKNRDAFFPAVTKADVWNGFDLPESFEASDAPSLAFDGSESALFQASIPILQEFTSTMVKLADQLGKIDLTAPGSADLDILINIFLYKTGENKFAPKYGSITEKAAKALASQMPELFALMDRVANAKAQLLSLDAAKKTNALHQFAQVFLPKYDEAKQRHGWLDFDDLILKARGLLSDSTMAQWVLFKLDNGIDHILVDEAQDTSPDQWAVIARLAEEFLTGEGAREIDRTLFVVGDEKQSIFSFQGANPATFAQMRDHFDQRLNQARSKLNQRELLFSFRSSSTILKLVDVILKENSGDLVSEVTHRAFHSELPGRIDLWPFLAPPEKAERPVWYEPLDMPSPDDPALQLASNIADAIHGILDRKELITTSKGVRPITAGDFLILVQRRSDIFHEIIKALKDKGLPVAGSDRLKIGGELAVRDLIALLSFMVTPEDSLSLAAALRSPLFRFTERDLFRLAKDRKGYLWQEMRAQKEGHASAFLMLTDLLKQADFLRPYELLERILTRHKGRDFLIARLGREAEDGIDALLTQAMQYEQTQAPSLTGFLGWMSTDESDIKRQMDTRSGEIRVMTVHGAKGLEAPIVILPDTAKRGPAKLAEIQYLENNLAVWKSSRPDSPLPLQAALDAKQLFLQQERMRLLYVALTRAENWLIVCGAGNQGGDGESWYMHVAAALDKLGAVDAAFEEQAIQRYQPFDWVKDAPVTAIPSDKVDIVLPDWVNAQPPAPSAKMEKINPSKLGGDKVVEGSDTAQSEKFALEYGQQIHALLEHLPNSEQVNWPLLGSRILNSQPGESLEIEPVLKEASNTLTTPELAFIFAPSTLAEVGISATFNNRVLDGVIDRLIVSETDILAVDFKSNAQVPLDANRVPLGYLQQMGAYAAALIKIYPNHKIETAILWTKTATLMRLPPKLVTDSFAEVTAS
ncbi:MAG: ATP-dependent helicase/nuclease subunit A, partial [Paracoccaceae bacterium]